MTKSGLLRTISGLTIFVVSWTTDGFGQESSEAKSTLAQVRQAIPDSFTLEVEIDLPVLLLMPGQGNTTQAMRITRAKGVIAIVWKASQLPAPKYFPPETGGYQSFDYDGEGNLIVSMWSEGATIHDQDTHQEYSESTGFRVAPDGTVAGQISGASLRRYSPSFSNTEGMSMLRVILRALGRSYGDDLGKLEAEKARPDGMRELRLTGQSSPYSGLGVWNMVVDPANGYLVRSASFGPRGGQPRTQFRSEGTRRFGDVSLAQRGEYVHPPQHISVRLVAFSATSNDELINEARNVIARARTRTVQVFDHREDPAHAKVRLVPAGELDKDK